MRNLEGHGSVVSQLAFDSSNLLASGSRDRKIKLWGTWFFFVMIINLKNNCYLIPKHLFTNNKYIVWKISCFNWGFCGQCSLKKCLINVKNIFSCYMIRISGSRKLFPDLIFHLVGNPGFTTRKNKKCPLIKSKSLYRPINWENWKIG